MKSCCFIKVVIFVHPITTRRKPIFFLFFISYLSSTLPCIAQDTDPWAGFGIEVNGFASKVLKHEAKFELPLPKLTTGTDINFQWKTYGKKEWQQRRKYPILGIAFAYTNYGIDSVYGRLFSLYPNVVIPLITGRKLEWTLRIGDGIGYATRDYSRINPFDTINNAIGSKINDYFSFMTDIRYHVNTHWDVQLGGNFSHYSDGSFHQPNLGVNLPGVHVGLKYFPETSTPKLVKRDLKPLKNRWLFQFRITMGFNESNAPLGPLYPIYLGTGYVSKRWHSKNKLFAGFDYSYSDQIHAYISNNGFTAPAAENWNSFKTAVFVGNEFVLGRVGVVLQFGYYTHQTFDIQEPYYEKVGGNLYLVQREHGPIKEFFLCAFLEAHLAVAEFAEFGFGMGI